MRLIVATNVQNIAPPAPHQHARSVIKSLRSFAPTSTGTITTGIPVQKHRKSIVLFSYENHQNPEAVYSPNAKALTPTNEIKIL